MDIKLWVYMMGDSGGRWRRELRCGYDQDTLYTYIKNFKEYFFLNFTMLLHKNTECEYFPFLDLQKRHNGLNNTIMMYL